MEEISFSRDVAIERGLLKIGRNSRVSASIRVIPREDDGSEYGPVEIGDDCVIREHVLLSTGCRIGNHVLIGHQSLFRRNIHVGDNCTFAHFVSIQRDVRIGSRCRISALTHVVAGTIVEDNVQIGAGVITVDDNTLTWPTGDLTPSIFRTGCRVGSGCTIMGGLEIGENTLVGAGSLVMRSLPPNVVAFGHPAYVQRDRVVE